MKNTKPSSIPKHAVLEYKCLPHSTAISAERHVTVAFRSLFWTERTEASSARNHWNVTEKHQFRIHAQIVSRMGQAHDIHATMLSTSNSSPVQVCYYEEMVPSVSHGSVIKATLTPLMTGTHYCTWDDYHQQDDGKQRENPILVFPIRYRDLSRDACIYIQLVTVQNRVIKQVYFPLWSPKGTLVTGLQRVNMTEEDAHDSHAHKNTIYPTIHHGSSDEKWEATLILDKIQQMQSKEDRHQPSSSVLSTDTSMSSDAFDTIQQRSTQADHVVNSHHALIHSVSWLDEITAHHCRNILQESINYDTYSDHCDIHSRDSNEDSSNDPWMKNTHTKTERKQDKRFQSPRMSFLESSSCQLILELLDCSYPIVYQELLLPHGLTVSTSSASGSVTPLDLSLYYKSNAYDPKDVPHDRLTDKERSRDVSTEDRDTVITDTNQIKKKPYTSGIYMPNPVPKNGRDDDMSLRLVQVLDPESQDDNPVEDKYRTLQHELIRGLVDPALKPNAEERSSLNAIISGTRQHLTAQEKDLLWRFRFSLVDNRQALTKFLLAVEWTVESEVVQAAELLEQWRRRSPIAVSDALKLLGKNVAFQTDLVRGYAIDTLQEAPDAELVLYLLQLVQALKYEHANDITASKPITSVSKKRNTRYSSLSEFLIERAATNMELANYLYWYLKVELDDVSFGRRYRDVFSQMREKLLCIEHESSTMTEHRSMWDVLMAQDIFISNIMDCQRSSRDAKGKKDAKEQLLRESLSKSLCQIINQDWSVPLPSAPHIWVKGVKADSARVFKSALYPALIDFFVDTKASSREAGPFTNGTYKVIVKTGDDLRQDQLVISLIKLMDRILKRGALDLCLTPYPILAMSQSTGLVTFVEGSIPISQVLSSYNNSILSFFKSVAPSQEGKYAVDPNVLQTYIRSCAGYCVITYLIGVGDRHLDNIMLQPSGHCKCYNSEFLINNICMHILVTHVIALEKQ